MMWSSGTVGAVVSGTGKALQNGSVPAAWRRGLEGLAFSSPNGAKSITSRPSPAGEGIAVRLEVRRQADEEVAAHGVIDLGVDVLVAGAGGAVGLAGERRVVVEHVVDARPEAVLVLDLPGGQKVDVALRLELGVGAGNRAVERRIAGRGVELHRREVAPLRREADAAQPAVFERRVPGHARLVAPFRGRVRRPAERGAGRAVEPGAIDRLVALQRRGRQLVEPGADDAEADRAHVVQTERVEARAIGHREVRPGGAQA